MHGPFVLSASALRPTMLSFWFSTTSMPCASSVFWSSDRWMSAERVNASQVAQPVVTRTLPCCESTREVVFSRGHVRNLAQLTVVVNAGGTGALERYGQVTRSESALRGGHELAFAFCLKAVILSWSLLLAPLCTDAAVKALHDMPRVNLSQLLSSLSSVLGHEPATRELRWMQQAAHEARPRRAPPLPDLPTMVARRVNGEPLQYILGTQPFGPLALLTRAPTLIPRPETEEWALRLADLLDPARPGHGQETGPPGATPKEIHILDLCTGSGCIPLLLCHLWQARATRATAVDVSTAAAQLARDNAEECQIQVHDPPAPGIRRPDVPGDESTFMPVVGDILATSFLKTLLGLRKGTRPFDLITSNPPYIPAEEYACLPPSVKDWEDPRALLGDPDPGAGSHTNEVPAFSPGQSWIQKIMAGSAGQPSLDSTGGTPTPVTRGEGLTFYRAIARLAAYPGVLRVGAPLVLEVGKGQARAVESILRAQQGVLTSCPSTSAWARRDPIFASRRSTRNSYDPLAHAHRLPGAAALAFGRTEVWVDGWGVERVVVGWRSPLSSSTAASGL